MGGTKKKGEKKFKLDEFLPIFSDVKKDKDMGTYEDFMECMKLYDKSENGLMIGAELFHILVSLGERLTEQEADDILKDCCPEETSCRTFPRRFRVKRLQPALMFPINSCQMKLKKNPIFHLFFFPPLYFLSYCFFFFVSLFLFIYLFFFGLGKKTEFSELGLQSCAGETYC